MLVMKGFPSVEQTVKVYPLGENPTTNTCVGFSKCGSSVRLGITAKVRLPHVRVGLR